MKRTRISVSVSPKEHSYLKHLSSKLGMTMQDLILSGAFQDTRKTKKQKMSKKCEWILISMDGAQYLYKAESLTRKK